MVKEFDGKWFSDILTNLHVLYLHAYTFWYEYFSEYKRLKFLLEHIATDSNILEITYYLRIWRSICLLRCWWFGFYRSNSYYTLFPTILSSSALSESSDIFIMHQHYFLLLWFCWIRNVSMEVITGEEISKVWTVGSSSASITLFIDGCLLRWKRHYRTVSRRK